MDSKDDRWRTLQCLPNLVPEINFALTPPRFSPLQHAPLPPRATPRPRCVRRAPPRPPRWLAVRWEARSVPRHWPLRGRCVSRLRIGRPSETTLTTAERLSFPGKMAAVRVLRTWSRNAGRLVSGWVQEGVMCREYSRGAVLLCLPSATRRGHAGWSGKRMYAK